jgi:signal transduction histidine kinase
MKRISADDLQAAIAARLVRARTPRRGGGPASDGPSPPPLLPDAVHIPLTVIFGSAGLLEHCHRDLGAAEIEVLARGILDAALRLHRLAENHTVCAQLERRRVSARRGADAPSPTSGAGDVRSAAKEAAFRGGRVGDLQLDLDDAVVPMAPAQLKRIVAELADNAFRFSNRGTAVQVALRADGAGCRLEIADGGMGMEAYQVHRAPKEPGGGLALVRRLAEATSGALEIQSRLAAGTTVRVLWRDKGGVGTPVPIGS